MVGTGPGCCDEIFFFLGLTDFDAKSQRPTTAKAYWQDSGYSVLYLVLSGWSWVALLAGTGTIWWDWIMSRALIHSVTTWCQISESHHG